MQCIQPNLILQPTHFKKSGDCDAHIAIKEDNKLFVAAKMAEGLRHHVGDNKRLQANENNHPRRVASSTYFSAQSFMVLIFLTASLLILPLILPPLPPPPLLLLVLPIAIFLVLLILAFMPSDVRNIASSYL